MSKLILFKFPKLYDVSEMRREIEDNEVLFSLITSRQEKYGSQRNTESIYLRIGVPEPDKPVYEWEQSKDADFYASKFPAIKTFMDEFIDVYGGELYRLMVVKLPLNKTVDKHIDTGKYYHTKDRFHLIIRGKYVYNMEGLRPVLFKEGHLWFFENQVVHWSQTIGNIDRYALIFDVKDSKWREFVSDEINAKLTNVTEEQYFS